MSETREEFEKLPIAAKYLPYVFFNKETQSYCNKSDNAVPLDFASFLNGAWYAFQEQQTKINAVLQYLDTGDHPLDFSANTIRELLR